MDEQVYSDWGKRTHQLDHAAFVAADLQRRAEAEQQRETAVAAAHAAAARADAACTAELARADEELTQAIGVRNAGVVRDALKALAAAWKVFTEGQRGSSAKPALAAYSVEAAIAYGEVFRKQDGIAASRRGYGLGREIAVEPVELYLARSPGSLQMFASDRSWGYDRENSLGSVIARTCRTLRDPHDRVGAQQSLIELERAVAETGAMVTMTADVPACERRYRVFRACLPPQLEEARLAECDRADQADRQREYEAHAERVRRIQAGDPEAGKGLSETAIEMIKRIRDRIN